MRDSSEFLERQFALCISIALVLEHGTPSDATMATDLGQLWNLSRLEQLDQIRTRNVEDVRRFLRSHGFIVLDDADVFAGEEQFRRPLDNAS